MDRNQELEKYLLEITHPVEDGEALCIRPELIHQVIGIREWGFLTLTRYPKHMQIPNWPSYRTFLMSMYKYNWLLTHQGE